VVKFGSAAGSINDSRGIIVEHSLVSFDSD
jgi:hypothetical protein